MDRRERNKHILKLKSRELERLDTHVADLYRLETEFGFDLDVATEIYGLDLLDATPESHDIATRWTEFFEALVSPGSEHVVICKTRNALVPGCYGFGQKEKYRPVMQTTLIETTSDTKVTYHEATSSDDNQSSACITLDGVKFAVTDTREPSAKVQWSSGSLTLAQPLDLSCMSIADPTSAVFSTGPLGIGAENVAIQDVSDRDGIHSLVAKMDLQVSGFSSLSLRPIEVLLGLKQQVARS